MSTAVLGPWQEPHRHSGRVHEALVEVLQSSRRVFLGLEAYKTELAELAGLGELERAVGHCAEGGEHWLEPLLLHLHTRHTHIEANRQTRLPLRADDVWTLYLPHLGDFWRWVETLLRKMQFDLLGKMRHLYTEIHMSTNERGQSTRSPSWNGRSFLLPCWPRVGGWYSRHLSVWRVTVKMPKQESEDLFPWAWDTNDSLCVFRFSFVQLHVIAWNVPPSDS